MSNQYDDEDLAMAAGAAALERENQTLRAQLAAAEANARPERSPEEEALIVARLHEAAAHGEAALDAYVLGVGGQLHAE